MCLDLFIEETPSFSILVSDHQVNAFCEVPFGRFDCSIAHQIWSQISWVKQALYKQNKMRKQYCILQNGSNEQNKLYILQTIIKTVSSAGA